MGTSNEITAHYRDILVAVCGLTPQVITETLYYLTQVRKPPSRITEVFVITTTRGKEKILRELLNAQNGKFHQFCKEFNIAPRHLRFDEAHILLTDPPLEDIRNEEDNQLMADAITHFVRTMTGDSTTALHCSVAGGRKTMSIYLAYALMLFGRAQDTLSHVLVSADFETHPEFFYVPKEDRNLVDRRRDGGGERAWALNTRDARISIATIPFVRLRKHVEELFASKGASYSQMVLQTQGEIDAFPGIDPLVVDLPKRELRIGSTKIKMQSMEIAPYALFAGLKRHNCRQSRMNCGCCCDCFIQKKDLIKHHGDRITEFYERAKGSAPKNSAYRRKLKDANIRSKITRINDKIKKELGKASKLYIIHADRLYGKSRYGILLEKAKITVIE